MAFQEEYLCEMYKSFVVGSTLGNMSHFEHKKIHLLSTSIKKDGKKSQNFYGHQKSALLTLEKVTHSTGCIAEGLTSTTIPPDIGWK